MQICSGIMKHDPSIHEGHLAFKNCAFKNCAK
jgi:hypothetical protein